MRLGRREVLEQSLGQEDWQRVVYRGGMYGRQSQQRCLTAACQGPGGVCCIACLGVVLQFYVLA